MVMNNLALVYGRQHRFQDAVSLLVNAIGTAQRVLRPGHPMTAAFMGTMAEVNALNGRADTALKWLDDAIRNGLGPPDAIASDEDLKPLWNDVRFKQLVDGMRAANAGAKQ
jgi:hypothetical protein